MISDWETNCVFFSGLLPERHPKVWRQLEDTLSSHRVPGRLIEGTRDIWARDYCPIQVASRQFVKFRYCPDYLAGWRRLLTPSRVSMQFESLGSCQRSNVILDGGNVVATKTKVILTEKIYRENPKLERCQLRSKLAELLGVDHCIIIPNEPGDPIGHSDGIVRFLDDNRVVVNDYSKVDANYGKRLCKVLVKEGLQVETITHFREDNIEDGIPSAAGNYVNYLRVGNLMLVPAYGIKHDDLACRTLERLCPQATVVPVRCKELARAGGILNCIAYPVYSRRLLHA